MKKVNIKKMGSIIALVVVIALATVVTIVTTREGNTQVLKDETTVSDGAVTNNVDAEPVTEVYTEIVEVVETSEKENGEIVTVKNTEVETKFRPVGATENTGEVTKINKTANTSSTNVIADTKAPVTTKPVVDKPVTTTQKPVTTTKPVSTTKKPTTTKPAKPTTTKAPKDEYYPSLTAADMEELKAYAANYIKSRGYKHNPNLTWETSGWSSRVGMCDNLEVYGDEFKVSKGGITPLEWAKRDIRDGVDATIDDFGEDSPWLEMTLLVERDAGGWAWAIGYMA